MMGWIAFALVLALIIIAFAGLAKLTLWRLRHRSAGCMEEFAKASTWKHVIWAMVVACLFLVGMFLYPWD